MQALTQVGQLYRDREGDEWEFGPNDTKLTTIDAEGDRRTVDCHPIRTLANVTEEYGPLELLTVVVA